MGFIETWLVALGELYGHVGYPLVLLGALGENTAFLGLILPGGTMTLLGAFYARQGTLNIGLVLLVAWLGTVAGYHIDYVLGRFVLARGVDRWGQSALARRMRLLGRLRLGRRFLARHGGKAILLSHAVGHVRSVVALTAGISAMPYRRFLAFEAIAALVWSSLYCLAGYALGSQWERVQVFFERFGVVAIIGLIVGYATWRLLRWRRAQQRQLRQAKGARPLPASE